MKEDKRPSEASLLAHRLNGAIGQVRWIQRVLINIVYLGLINSAEASVINEYLDRAISRRKALIKHKEKQHE